jgi:hypothetical protein
MENLIRSEEYWSLIEHGVTIAAPNATAELTRLANESKLRDQLLHQTNESKSKITCSN